MSTTPKKKNIMRAFKLNEISAVDAPAQEGAVVVIMKSDTSLLKNKGDLIALAKAMRSDPEHALAKRMAANVDAVLKGDKPDGLITAADVYRFMMAYALARKTPSETLALAWGRLMISDKPMMAFYAAHQQLIIMGRKGEPNPDTISEAEAREVDEPVNRDGDPLDENVTITNREDQDERRLGGKRSY